MQAKTILLLLYFPKFFLPFATNDESSCHYYKHDDEITPECVSVPYYPWNKKQLVLVKKLLITAVVEQRWSARKRKNRSEALEGIMVFGLSSDSPEK